MYLSKKEVRRLLPNVGDKRKEVPTGIYKDTPGIKPKACACTVVEVNRAHLWYRVKFKDSGLFECYKVPELAPPGGVTK